MKKMVADRDIEVSSAGTGALSGVPASPEAIEVMQEEGVDITAHTSRHLDGFLIEEADQVLVMTESHFSYIISWFKSMKQKVRLLREFDPVKNDGLYPNIPDPIGAPVEEYRRVKEMLKRSITELERRI